ncbi:hypothetical protein HDU76_012705 [Blyttiomyces sp. JEL0837]|nr:hypothetical protein HDU76_012705 [Blyttiomyces sp. JEL0837]
MKIDVEGYEVKAFLGATEFLKNAPPYFVFSEIYTGKLRDTGFDAVDYIKLMEKNGYTTYTTSKRSPYIIGEEAPTVDVVFVHKEILDSQGRDLSAMLGV